MLLNAGIITEKLRESKLFYTEILGFQVKFETDWFLLLHTATHADHELAFMLPNLSSQQPVFRTAFSGKGIWLTLEVENIKQLYQALQSRQVPIEVALRDEPWGEAHFTIIDPNGIGVDIVERSKKSSVAEV